MSLHILMFESEEVTHYVDTKNRLNAEKLLTLVPSALHALFWIIFTAFIESRYYYYLHFVEMKIEVWGG